MYAAPNIEAELLAEGRLGVEADLDEGCFQILARIVEAGVRAGAPAQAALRGATAPGGERTSDLTKRGQHRARVMQKRGLVDIKGGKITATKRGRTALKTQQEKGKLKPGEKMVFGKKVKVNESLARLRENVAREIG